MKQLWTKYGVNKDSLSDFSDFIKGLQKPFAWTPTEFDNRNETLLRYWMQLSGETLSEEQIEHIRKKIMIGGVPSKFTSAFNDSCRSLHDTSIGDLIYFMNEQKAKYDGKDKSASTDDDDDDYSSTPKQKKRKSNHQHVIVGSNDRCPHCRHNHTWANCKVFIPDAPGYFGNNRRDSNPNFGSNYQRGQYQQHTNNRNGYGSSGGGYTGITHPPQNSHHYDYPDGAAYPPAYPPSSAPGAPPDSYWSYVASRQQQDRQSALPGALPTGRARFGW